MDIDYNHPELYLVSGNQSYLDEDCSRIIETQVEVAKSGIEGVAEIFRWKQNYFGTYSARGALVGKTTINQLIEKKELSGCHDHALVLASVFRFCGYPAIMVDAAGIQWAKDYSEGKQISFSGHVFVEVYIDNNWILVNSTSSEYVENYNPHNPVIPMTNPDESTGYFTMLKGLDPEDYGVTSLQQLKKYMEAFAADVQTLEMQFPEYEIKYLH
ncbi:transglutaminase domain-containing protein [Chloroflexota bacterium]